MESHWLMTYYSFVELEAGGCETVAGAWVAAVEDWHVVLLGHSVDGGKERGEVLLGVDVFFSMSTQEDVLAFLESETLVDIACLYVGKVLVQDFGHRGAGDVGALAWESAFGKVATGVLGVGHVDVGDDIDDAAVGLLREAFVFTSVSCFHVENRYVKTFSTYN